MRHALTLALVVGLPQEPSHELHVRSYAEICKEAEAKQKEIPAFKARIDVMVSSSAEDQTTHLTGELYVQREEKKPPRLLWRLKRGDAVVERAFHDGAQVTVTDESEPKDLRYKQGPTGDARFALQEIVLAGGRGLEKRFTACTLMDPKLAKAKRTISTKVEQALDKKEGEKEPEAAQIVDRYAFQMTPKDVSLKAELEGINLQLDAATMQLFAVVIRDRHGNVVIATIRDVAKLEAKEIAESKVFEFKLGDGYRRE